MSAKIVVGRRRSSRVAFHYDAADGLKDALEDARDILNSDDVWRAQSTLNDGEANSLQTVFSSSARMSYSTSLVLSTGQYRCLLQAISTCLLSKREETVSTADVSTASPGLKKPLACRRRSRCTSALALQVRYGAQVTYTLYITLTWHSAVPRLFQRVQPG